MSDCIECGKPCEASVDIVGPGGMIHFPCYGERKARSYEANSEAKKVDDSLSRVTEQAAPVANDNPAIWPLVIADMQARDQEGRRKYGVPPQSLNGRNGLIDGYQEALDLTVYLRQCMEEATALGQELRALEHTMLRDNQPNAYTASIDSIFERYAFLGQRKP